MTNNPATFVVPTGLWLIPAIEIGAEILIEIYKGPLLVIHLIDVAEQIGDRLSDTTPYIFRSHRQCRIRTFNIRFVHASTNSAICLATPEKPGG